MAQLGMKQQLVGGSAFGMPAMLAIGKDLMNGTLFIGPSCVDPASLPDSDSQKAYITDWMSAYKAKYNNQASMMAGNGTDAISILANALKTAGNDRTKLRDAIEQTSNLVGTNGIFTYSAADHTGLQADSLGMFTVENVQFTLVSMFK